MKGGLGCYEKTRKDKKRCIPEVLRLLIDSAYVLEIMRETQRELEVLLYSLMEERFVDSEKYALARFEEVQKTITPSDEFTLLKKTIHLHSYNDVCIYCSAFISKYFRLTKNIPFVSSYWPYEDRRHCGHDGQNTSKIDLNLFLKKGIYPQCVIIPDFTCLQTLEALDDTPLFLDLTSIDLSPKSTEALTDTQVTSSDENDDN